MLWPKSASSIKRPGAAAHLLRGGCRREIHADPDVENERHALAVLRAQHHLIALSRDLDVFRRDGGDIFDRGPPVEKVLDDPSLALPALGVVGDSLELALNGQELHVGRYELEGDER